eukprot:1137517-Pelagomonas_calceolata.AAC.4
MALLKAALQGSCVHYGAWPFCALPVVQHMCAFCCRALQLHSLRASLACVSLLGTSVHSPVTLCSMWTDPAQGWGPFHHRTDT